jgi:uncharacterized surface protein with fasciclin (FAS1) repeats
MPPSYAVPPLSPGSSRSAELKTVSGDTLWIVWEGDKLWLRDEKGMNAAIAIADVDQKNGVIHVIDTAVMAN